MCKKSCPQKQLAVQYADPQEGAETKLTVEYADPREGTETKNFYQLPTTDLCLLSISGENET